jgi:hypothetical protein
MVVSRLAGVAAERAVHACARGGRLVNFHAINAAVLCKATGSFLGDAERVRVSEVLDADRGSVLQFSWICCYETPWQ